MRKFIKFKKIFFIVFFGRFAFAEISTRSYDWDDNIFRFRKEDCAVVLTYKNGTTRRMTTGDFAKEDHKLPWKVDGEQNITANFDEMKDLEGKTGKNSNFVTSIRKAIRENPDGFKGPAWEDFAKTMDTQLGANRMSIITARGHTSESLMEGLKVLQEQGLIRHIPQTQEHLHGVSSDEFSLKHGEQLRSYKSKLGRLSASEKKVIVMMKQLDDLQTDAIEKKRKYPDYVATWSFSDDDPKNIAAAKKLLQAEIDKGRWPFVKIKLHYTGPDFHEGLETKNILHPKVSSRQDCSGTDPFSEIKRTASAVSACAKSLVESETHSGVAATGPSPHQPLTYDISKLSNRPPAPIHFDPNSPECQGWLEAHRKFCGEEEYEAAKALLASTHLYTYDDLQNAILNRIDGVTDGIAEQLKTQSSSDEKKLVLVVDKGKSNEWLAVGLLDRLRNKLNNSGIQFDIVQNNENGATTREKRHLEQYIEKNPKVKNYLMLDDALYSGSQIRMWTKDLAWSVHNLTAGTTAVHDDKLKEELSKKPLKLYYIPGFASESGENFAMSINDEKMDIPGRSGSWSQLAQLDIQKGATRLPNLPSQMTPDQLNTLKKMHPDLGTPRIGNIDDRWNTLTSVFFQHKVPSGWSAESELLRFGRVRCKAPNTYVPDPKKLGDFPEDDAPKAPNVLKNSYGVEYQFGCVPFVKPPYKDKAEYSNYGNINSLKQCTPPPAPFKTSAECGSYVWSKRSLMKQLMGH